MGNSLANPSLDTECFVRYNGESSGPAPAPPAPSSAPPASSSVPAPASSSALPVPTSSYSLSHTTMWYLEMLYIWARVLSHPLFKRRAEAIVGHIWAIATSTLISNTISPDFSIVQHKVMKFLLSCDQKELQEILLDLIQTNALPESEIVCIKRIIPKTKIHTPTIHQIWNDIYKPAPPSFHEIIGFFENNLKTIEVTMAILSYGMEKIPHEKLFFPLYLMLDTSLTETTDPALTTKILEDCFETLQMCSV